MARVLAVLRDAALYASALLIGLVTGTALRAALWYGYWLFGVALP